MWHYKHHAEFKFPFLAISLQNPAFVKRKEGIFFPLLFSKKKREKKEVTLASQSAGYIKQLRQGKTRTARDWLFPFGGNNKCAHLYFNNITTGPPNYTNILVINCRRAEKESFCTDLSLRLKKKLLSNHFPKSWPKSEDEDISALCDESFVS